MLLIETSQLVERLVEAVSKALASVPLNATVKTDKLYFHYTISWMRFALYCRGVAAQQRGFSSTVTDIRLMTENSWESSYFTNCIWLNVLNNTYMPLKLQWFTRNGRMSISRVLLME